MMGITTQIIEKWAETKMFAPNFMDKLRKIVVFINFN